MPKPTGPSRPSTEWHSVRLPSHLRDRVKLLAHRERRSVAMMAAILLEQALEAHTADRGR